VAYLARYLALPRGCHQLVTDLFRENNVKVQLDDKRVEGTPIHAVFTGSMTTLSLVT
jgi:hypothetical protein